MQPAIKGLERECWGATDGIQKITGPEQHDSNFYLKFSFWKIQNRIYIKNGHISPMQQFLAQLKSFSGLIIHIQFKVVEGNITNNFISDLCCEHEEA